MVVQNPLDRVPGDVVAEIRERATDARVPPRWILDRHPHYEVGHLAWRYRPASTAAGAAVVLPGNQPPAPAENRVRRDDAGDLRQNPPAEFLASHRELTALGVGQAKWTWAKVLSEDPILLSEIIDHVFLVAVHPASGREYEEAQSVGHSLRLLGEQPLAPTLFRRFANLGRFVAPYGVTLVGRVRTDLFRNDIGAIERHEIVCPRIDAFYTEHKYCGEDDLFGSGHPPDTVVAMALAYHAFKAGRQPGDYGVTI